VVLLMLAWSSPASAQEGDAGRVLVTELDGAVTPVIAEHLRDAVARAERGQYRALVVRIDTPGGLDTSMRRIVQRFLGADVPVVVYVAPRGARAASAGAIIAFSAHVAAMAPGTAIGASTPVELEGGDVERKVVNDAAAFAEAIARLRDRNVEFAVDTVREGRSAAADEAVAVGAVDLLAASLDELLDRVDGRTVTIGEDGRKVVMRTAGALSDRYDLGLLRRIQQVLADPNLAYIFLSLGTLGIIYEFASPGIGAGGVLGTVFILLALFALSVLPVSAVGLLLLGLAAALFVAELFAPGVGIAAAGGSLCLVLSGLFLFRDAPGLDVSLTVVAPVAVVVGGAVVLAGRLVVRSQLEESTSTGPGLFRDRVATVRRVADDRAMVFLEGAWWTARSAGRALREGDTVRVVDVDGLDLVVETAGDPPIDNRQTGAS
jgi:membrane-bound serine protease (ClpP class)